MPVKETKAHASKLASETVTCLSDLIENEAYEIPAWVRTCLRGIRQNVIALAPKT